MSQIIRQCLAASQEARPSIDSVLAQLEEIAQQQAHRPAAASVNPGTFAFHLSPTHRTISEIHTHTYVRTYIHRYVHHACQCIFDIYESVMLLTLCNGMLYGEISSRESSWRSAQQRSKRVPISDVHETLIQLLASAVWNCPYSAQHSCISQ